MGRIILSMARYAVVFVAASIAKAYTEFMVNLWLKQTMRRYEVAANNTEKGAIQ